MVPILPLRRPVNHRTDTLEQPDVTALSTRRSVTPLLLTLWLLATACAEDDRARSADSPPHDSLPEQAFDALTDSAILDGPGHHWPTHGGNLANHRFSPLDQIRPGNVHDLVPVWIYSTGLQGAFATTPLVVSNTLYLTTARGDVVALAAASGQELWRFTPQLGPVTLCCGPINSGVSIYNETVYVSSLDAKLYALDMTTGEPRWEARLADPTAGYSATMAPLAVEGRVYVGVAGEAYGIRGFLAAFDAESGEELWRWHTTRSASDGGWWGQWAETDPFGTVLNRDIAAEQAARSGADEVWRVGGGGIATTPAYDPDQDRLYVNVEGPAPMLAGSIRPGDNLYTGSIVALDGTSGELVWHAQYLPHDVWGLSGGSPPFLFDRGGERYVGFAGRTGWVYVFSTADGRPILRSDNFVPQEALFARRDDREAVRMAPGARGGNPGTGVAYDPTTGTAFVGGVHQPMVYRPAPAPYRRGGLWVGGELRFPPDAEQWGTVTAIDLGTGEIRWQKETPGPAHSSALATAGGLVFMGQGSGAFDAFDARSGELLWQFNTGAGVHGGPITYRVGPVQYVVVPAGGSYQFDTPAGDDLIAFALASRRPARTASYPSAQYRRGGPTGPAADSVRQQRSEQPSDSVPDRDRDDADSGADGGGDVDSGPGRR